MPKFKIGDRIRISAYRLEQDNYKNRFGTDTKDTIFVVLSFWTSDGVSPMVRHSNGNLEPHAERFCTLVPKQTIIIKRKPCKKI